MRGWILNPQLEDINCGTNRESGFQVYAHEILFLLLAALSSGFGQGSISISVNLNLPISFCLMLLILLFIGIKVFPAASLQDFFWPMLINHTNTTHLMSFNILKLFTIYVY